MPHRPLADRILEYLDDPVAPWTNADELADLLVDGGVASSFEVVADAIMWAIGLGSLVHRHGQLGELEIARASVLRERDLQLTVVTSQTLPLRTWVG